MKILDENELRQLNLRQLWRYMNKLSVHCMYGMVVEDTHIDNIEQAKGYRKGKVVNGDILPVTISKVKRFNRKAKMAIFNRKQKKNNPSGDLSIIRTGKPGSHERIEAYRQWNECNNEVSPFMEE